MKLTELHEGMMKRSDPYISGARSVPTQPVALAKKKESPHSQKIAALAKTAKVKPEVVAQLWDEERDKVDEKHPNRWAIVMNNVKRRLAT